MTSGQDFSPFLPFSPIGESAPTSRDRKKSCDPMEEYIYISSDEEYIDVDDDGDYEDYIDGGDDDDQVSMDGLDGFDDGINPLPCNLPSYKIITRESLVAAQREDMRKVMDLLSVKEDHARALLVHYRWDVDKVLQLLVEDGQDKLFAEVGVLIMDYDGIGQPKSLFSSVECGICFDEFGASEVTSMDCSHVFCNSCWTSHFIVKINEGQSRRIKCMRYKCNAICEHAKIKRLVSSRDPSAAEIFDQFLLESYIEDNKRVKWCPSVPHCGNAIQVVDDGLHEVECSCDKQFCFRCLSEVHSPCSCLMWELWSKKCQDASVTWIIVHTRLCPKCHKPVEKNGGCNLVPCVCGQAFCLVYGSTDCATINDHSCGRYEKDQLEKFNDAKVDLARYIHYHSRYKAHLDFFELESKLEKSIEEKISYLERRESQIKNYTWITNGLYRLSRSRRILSLTYPFAYYMFGNDLRKDGMKLKEKELKKSLFEDQQQQFERNVERLSLFLEEEFDEYDDDKIMDLRHRIISVSVSTDNLCQNLYNCIENDFMGSLTCTTHEIAPYRLKGVFNGKW